MKPRLTSVNRLIDFAREGESGRLWYAEATNEVAEAADILGITAERFAHLLALFSPRVAVLRNIRLAVRYAETGEYAPTVMKPIRAAVEHYENTGEIRGPKTGPFADAILGDSEAIVLDVWMAVAFGIPQELLSRKPIHAECCRRIRQAAKRLGWTPAEVQAAVWTATVKRAGKTPGRFRIVHRTLWGTELERAA